MKKIKTPKIIGHRGACGLAPENTMSSLIEASFFDLTFIEVDVKISKDRIPLLLHDDNLERTTNGFGICSDHDFNDLLMLDAGSWFNNDFAGEKIPSLEECLQFLYKNNIGVNIELKPNKGKEEQNIIEIKKLLESKNFSNYFISSFDVLSLKIASNLMISAPKGFLISEDNNKESYSLEDMMNICSQYNCFSIGLDSKMVNSEIIKFFKQKNLIITVFTVNNLDLANYIFDCGADSIFTDRPDIVKI